MWTWKVNVYVCMKGYLGIGSCRCDEFKLFSKTIVHSIVQNQFFQFCFQWELHAPCVMEKHQLHRIRYFHHSFVLSFKKHKTPKSVGYKILQNLTDYDAKKKCWLHVWTPLQSLVHSVSDPVCSPKSFLLWNKHIDRSHTCFCVEMFTFICVYSDVAEKQHQPVSICRAALSVMCHMWMWRPSVPAETPEMSNQTCCHLTFFSVLSCSAGFTLKQQVVTKNCIEKTPSRAVERWTWTFNPLWLYLECLLMCFYHSGTLLSCYLQK